MTPATILEELVRLAARLGVDVRFDSFSIHAAKRGGMCRLRGRATILIDQTLPVLDQIGIITEALAHFDLEPLYVPPIVRARLHRITERPHEGQRPLLPPRPRPLARARRRPTSV
jgi:hypothetical protein